MFIEPSKALKYRLRRKSDGALGRTEYLTLKSARAAAKYEAKFSGPCTVVNWDGSPVKPRARFAKDSEAQQMWNAINFTCNVSRRSGCEAVAKRSLGKTNPK